MLQSLAQPTHRCRRLRCARQRAPHARARARAPASLARPTSCATLGGFARDFKLALLAAAPPYPATGTAVQPIPILPCGLKDPPFCEDLFCLQSNGGSFNPQGMRGTRCAKQQHSGTSSGWSTGTRSSGFQSRATPRENLSN